MTEQILEAYRQKISRVVLIPSSGGRFEVTANGELIYSKKATGKHAEPAQVVEAIGQRLAAG